MTDVFISYKREEREHARKLAQALESRGFSVWWDAEILPGERYRAVTLQILQECHCAIVVWSPQAVASNWVLDEAQRGLDRGVLLPVIVEPIQHYPLGFGQVHAHNLVGWEGGADEPMFQPVLAAVERMAGKRQAGAPKPESPEVEVAFWRGVQDSRNARDFEAYLARYKDGMFADLARERIAALKPAEPYRKQAFADPKPAPVRAAPLPPYTVWELGFIAVCAVICAVLSWLIVNLVFGYGYYFPDIAALFDPTKFRNVYLFAPVLTAIAWGWDRAVAWLGAKEDQPFQLAARFLAPALLIVAMVIMFNSGQALDDREAHWLLWFAGVWTAATYARQATAWLRSKAAAARS
ncbi:MAG: toll/interleukin-1 receptor domain-containing protein [Caulobacterales bacterium]